VLFIKEAAMPNEFPPDDLRNVWQNQPVENTPMPLEEIQRRARRFEKRIDRRNLREYAGAAIGIAAYTFYIFIFHSLMVRAGSVLVIAGVLYVVVQLYRRASSGSLPEDLGVAASIEFHRRELVRQRDMLRSVWRWYIAPIVPGLVVFSAGIVPHHSPGWAYFVLVLFYCAAFGGIVWLNHRAAGSLDRQIAELDQ
jgi:Flp pilus assembly protein TadB